MVVDRVAAGRLADLRSRIEQARVGSEQGGRAPAASASSPTSLAFRVGIEMVVALGLCAGLGLAVDNWFQSWPVATIIGFFLGAGAGIRNVYHAGSRVGNARNGS